MGARFFCPRSEDEFAPPVRPRGMHHPPLDPARPTSNARGKVVPLLIRRRAGLLVLRRWRIILDASDRTFTRLLLLLLL